MHDKRAGRITLLNSNLLLSSERIIGQGGAMLDHEVA